MSLLFFNYMQIYSTFKLIIVLYLFVFVGSNHVIDKTVATIHCYSLFFDTIHKKVS